MYSGSTAVQSAVQWQSIVYIVYMCTMAVSCGASIVKLYKTSVPQCKTSVSCTVECSGSLLCSQYCKTVKLQRLVPIVDINKSLVRNKGWQGWKLERILQIKHVVYQTIPVWASNACIVNSTSSSSSKQGQCILLLLLPRHARDTPYDTPWQSDRSLSFQLWCLPSFPVKKKSILLLRPWHVYFPNGSTPCI